MIDAKTWRLDVAGMVGKPVRLTLDELKALPAQEVISTIECSGNNGLPFATSTIGNARWAGASLAAITSVGTDQERCHRSGVLRLGQGEEVVRKDTPLEIKFTGNFARSMSIDDAMNPANMLCYEMNGAPLPAANGFPVRLIVPGWYRRGQCQVASPHRGARYPLSWGGSWAATTSPSARSSTTGRRS